MRPLPILALTFFRLACRQGPRAAARTGAAKLSRWLLRLSGYELATLEARTQLALAASEARVSRTIDRVEDAVRDLARTHEALHAALARRLEQLDRREVEGRAALQTALEADRRHLAEQVQPLRDALWRTADSIRHLTRLGVERDRPVPASRLRISVIVPVHNRAAQLGPCIDSVLAQHGVALELIVVDDGSTDAFEEALAPYEADPRLTWLRLPHGGENRARNAGLRAATGEVIVNLDSDNRMCPGYLARLAATYADAPDARCALAAMLWDDDAGHVHLRHDRFAWDRVLSGAVGIDTNAFSFRRQLWQELGGWDESLTRLSDFDLVLRYTRIHPPVRVPAVAAYYDFRSHADRITTTRAYLPNAVRIRARWRTPIVRPLRVLIVCYDYPQLSESYVDTEVRWLTRQGVEVEVCSMEEPGAVGEATVRVHRCGLDRAIADFRPDLLHCHWINMVGQVAEQAQALGLPLTLRGHGFDVVEDTVRACDAAGATRITYLFPHLAARYGEGRPTIRPLASAFNSQRHYPRHSRKDRRLVLRAAACLETKEIESFFHIAAACPGHRFVLALAHIALRPHLPPHFEALNASLGSPVEIRWDVPYDDMAALYAEAAIYLHTFDFAYTFGMPVSIVESMACGAVPLLRESPDVRAYAGACALYYETVDQAVAQLEAMSRWSDAQWRTRAVECADHAYRHHADEVVLPALLDDWMALVPPVARHAGTVPEDRVGATEAAA